LSLFFRLSHVVISLVERAPDFLQLAAVGIRRLCNSYCGAQSREPARELEKGLRLSRPNRPRLILYKESSSR
jgi:hypothetical protein